jgi:hypothetical protein
VGAFLAVPVVASIEIAIAHLQAREVPVAQDPAGLEDAEPEDEDDAGEAVGGATATPAERPL